MVTKMDHKRLGLLFLWVLTVLTVQAQGPNNSGTYYANAHGKCGAALKTALFKIVSPHTNIGYDGLYEAYKKTDTRADGYVRDWYSNATNYQHGVNNKGNYSQEGDMYNREHSVPQSWFSEASPMKADIVHVLPTDGYVNNRRSNHPLAEVGNVTWSSKNGYSKLGSCRTTGYSGTVFEPNDEIKGDMARIYFYMVTCYEDKATSWGNAVFANTKYPGFEPWYLDLLMRWSKQDPVDEVERARNQAVYEVQKNRNPFVDYPGLEDYVWGTKKDQPFSYDGGEVEPVDPDPVDPDPVDPDIASEYTISLNNTLFGTTFNGSIEKSNTQDLVGTANGVTVVYSLGTGDNRYCNNSQIRLYQKNTLTFTTSGDELCKMEFQLAKNSSKTLSASTGTVKDLTWEGKANSVTFNVDDGSGNMQLTGVKIYLNTSDVVLGITNNKSQSRQQQSVYTLSGRRVKDGRLKKGLYIKNKKKAVVR